MPAHVEQTKDRATGCRGRHELKVTQESKVRADGLREIVGRIDVGRGHLLLSKSSPACASSMRANGANQHMYTIQKKKYIGENVIQTRRVNE
jgi:hypothetical protein